MLTPFSGRTGADAYGYVVCLALAAVAGVVAAGLLTAGFGVGAPLIGLAVLVAGSWLIAGRSRYAFRLVLGFAVAFALVTWPAILLVALGLSGGFE